MSSIKPGQGGYPVGWLSIRERILARAGRKCRCLGECGYRHLSGRCGVPDGAYVRRSGPRWVEVGPLFKREPGVRRIALQVAHLNHDPSDVRDGNLRALCSFCHTRYDAQRHQQTRAVRVRAAIEAAGQLAFTAILT